MLIKQPDRCRKAMKGSNQRLRREKLHCVSSHWFIMWWWRHRFN